MDYQKLFLTFFYTGLSKKAPGTVGTLAGLLAGVVFLLFLPKNTLFAATLAITIIAIFEINKYEKKHDASDPKEIVIDEVAGIWLVLMMIPFDFVSILLGFVFFRIYDIFKPSIIGRVDKRLKGGLGVMLDDILAGFFAGITVLVVLALYEKYLLPVL
ncbi:MAG: phosphatidylglycerophosphatase [Campylobacterota bacterium]|nr:phosphatidylglycerophosphatase [Campylobacterota bacterium]